MRYILCFFLFFSLPSIAEESLDALWLRIDNDVTLPRDKIRYREGGAAIGTAVRRFLRQSYERHQHPLSLNNDESVQWNDVSYSVRVSENKAEIKIKWTFR